MACIIAMLAPPVVLEAGSSPVGQLPANAASSRTVNSPPCCGSPAAAWVPVPVPPVSPPPHADSASAVARRMDGIVRFVMWVLPLLGRPRENWGLSWELRVEPSGRGPLVTGRLSDARHCDAQDPGRRRAGGPALARGGRQFGHR